MDSARGTKSHGSCEEKGGNDKMKSSDEHDQNHKPNQKDQQAKQSEVESNLNPQSTRCVHAQPSCIDLNSKFFQI